MKSKLVTVKTIHPKHIEQLHWQHDEHFDLSGMTNLGKHEGAMIFEDRHGNLHRVSITVVFLQSVERLCAQGVPWKEANQKTREEIAKAPQLFTDDSK